MASTVTAADLKVKITEEVILNGKDQGGTTELTISSINEIYKRIVTCAANAETTLVHFHLCFLYLLYIHQQIGQ